MSGTVAVRSEDFPARGYYCATNAFSENSIVRLENTASGKAVEVYIISGLTDYSATFVISAEAADALGMGHNEIATVDASLIRVMNPVSVQKENVNAAEIVESKTGSTKKIYPVYPDKSMAASSVPVDVPVAVDENAPGAGIISEPAAPAPLEDNAADTAGKNYIQIGSFNTYENAEAFISDLVSSYPLIISRDAVHGNFKVLAGPVEYNELDEALAEFREAGFVDAFKNINE